MSGVKSSPSCLMNLEMLKAKEFRRLQNKKGIGYSKIGHHKPGVLWLVGIARSQIGNIYLLPFPKTISHFSSLHGAVSAE
jgi:Gpi18-like mannosyltransferase